MDDSDLDFVDLSSKLSKRGPKKPPRRAQPTIQGDKRRRVKTEPSESKCVPAAGASRQPGGGPVVPNGASGTTGPAAVRAPGGTRAKEQVLRRMQQFKRVSPQRMLLQGGGAAAAPSPAEAPDAPQPSGSGVRPPTPDSDEALALRLQQQLDREAAEAQTVDLEDGGLFFCQICQRDLSHMTAEGRTHHINRCLDEIEQPPPAPPPPPPPPGVPDCPICGKRFKSQKSRSAHLKRCSSDMGVSPADLLRALQRQAEETQNAAAATTSIAQAGGTKRKGADRLPARKKPRIKSDPLDEDTMVALALSSSLLEQERGGQAERAPWSEATAAASHASSDLRWRPDAGKGRGKKRKGAVSRPPPLLLVQDAKAAVARLQERVAALLLRGRAPSPPTPTRCPSGLPSCSSGAPLWQKSALLDSGGSGGESDFYSPELSEFITPWVPVEAAVDPPLRPASERTPVTKSSASVHSSSQAASCSPAPSSQPLSVGSQTLRDVMELAEDGMTLTQCGYAAKVDLLTESRASHLHLSGFIVEEQQQQEQEQDDLGVSGFLRENTHQKDTQSRAGGSDHQAVALSRLASDLSGMVNNPQLSDIQMQVDSGEVFFAHSFMVYARCPLLVEMVHESGIGVREEGVPAAQRVLVSDVPAEAVSALLRYLYTAEVAVPPSLRPHLLELAARFDLQELRQLCERHCEEAAAPEEHLGEQTEQAFMELLQSMWKEEEEEEEEEDNDGDTEDTDDGKQENEHQPADVTLDNREIPEERVNEDELEEIYEFAATQRKREEENEGKEEEEEEEEEDGQHPLVFSKGCKSQQPHRSLDSSYNRLFSQTSGVLHEGRSPASLHSSSSPPDTHRPQPAPASSKPRGRTLLQSSGSAMDDPSFSPATGDAHLPVPGLSPGGAGAEDRGPARGESGAEPRTREEPELIVLSDSSEDVGIDVKPSPSPPVVAVVTQRYTHVKPHESTSNKQPSGFGTSPADPWSAGECSPELSWLIPSTPLRPDRTRTSTSSSTQTRSSMYRTQLFPESVAASPPRSPTAPTGGGVLKTAHSSDVFIGSSRHGNVESSVFAEPARLSKPLPFLGLSKQDTPLHLQPQPHSSSTPLHTDILRRAALPSASPLHAGPERRRSGGQEEEVALSGSSDNTEVASFQLSLFSPDPPPRSPGGGLQIHSEGSEGSSRTGAGLRGEEEEGKEEAIVEAREESAEAEAAESSFRQSFMDEPPMAFNDSWGFDACADSPANPGRFSLRLEDSRGSDPGCRETDALPSALPTTSAPPGPSNAPSSPPRRKSFLDSALWDSWEEEEEALPLSQRVKPPTQTKTPVSSRSRGRGSLVPITPTPHFSDMDTPELKTKLNRFGVRPLPKRQMILKLKEIHQYTHQLLSSESEDEPAETQHLRAAPTVSFKEPRAPAASTAAIRPTQEENEEEPLSTSQDSTTSTVASEGSERSNPEQCLSSGGDSDSNISASQAGSQLPDRLQAVRAFILADSELYGQILQYRPLVLAHFQQQLKAAGIRLGTAKLMDYLDSQCITFTTAKPGKAAARGRGRKAARGRKRRAGEAAPREQVNTGKTATQA